MRSQPRHAVSCNCTICRSLGSVWGHSLEADITIFAAPDATIAYSRGDRLLACHTSRTCGSTTHYFTIAGDHMGRMAVNLQLAAPGTIDAIGLRHFAGADTWSFRGSIRFVPLAGFAMHLAVASGYLFCWLPFF